MEFLVNPVFLTALLVAAVGATMPLLLAATGETLGEQAGVLNLGIEGIMLGGAYSAFVTVLSTGNLWLGMLAGLLVGALMSLVMLVLGVLLGLDQVVIGLAITLLGGGITSVAYLQRFATSSPGLGAPPAWPVPLLEGIPVLGAGLFSQPVAFWLCLLAVVIVGLVLSRTRLGLAVRAAGQNPLALDAAGGAVLRTRGTAVLVAGAFAGLGGAYLAICTTSTFTPFFTGGLGFIAIVMTMLARGRILWLVLVSVLYGFAVAIGTALQLTEAAVPADLIAMLPFVLVMAVLIVFARRSGVPPALGVAYRRGVR